MMRLFLRNPGINLIIKRTIANLSGTKNFLENCWTSVTDNIVFLKILGNNIEEGIDLDLENKTCLITGASSGIGLELTKRLSSRGCKVLMACRNTYAANGVVKNSCDISRLHFYEVNLTSMKSVKTCSEEILRNEKKIDILFLNAAVFGLPWTLTEDGLETTFQVNYLSQYYLLMNIEKILAPDARVVFLSSESHRNVKWTLSNMLAPTEELVSLPEDHYTSIKAYNTSKLCGILAMHFLGYHWMNSRKQVFCAHPGSFVYTRLCRNWWVYEALYASMRPFSKTVSQAVETPLYCATSPELAGLSALYYKDCQIYEESELAKNVHLSFRIQDLTRDIIRKRVAVTEEFLNKVDQPTEHRPKTRRENLNDPLISDYTST